jgi:polyisoprenoid-binding protein YceI
MGKTQYVLDVKTSKFTVQAFAEGLAGIADHRPTFFVREFSGEMEFDPDKLDVGSLQLTAKTRSLAIMDEVTQLDRKAIERVMFGEVLQSDRFPEVTFRSTRVACSAIGANRYRADVTGMMLLHGVENLETVQAQLTMNLGSLRAHGEFRLRQTDYDLAIASVAGGLLRIKNELKFVFYFVAPKKNGA